MHKCNILQQRTQYSAISIEFFLEFQIKSRIWNNEYTAHSFKTHLIAITLTDIYS